MFPTVAGAEAIVVNLKGADGKPLTDPVKFPAGSTRRYLPGQDHEVE